MKKTQIYHFYCYGEIIESIEDSTRQKAIEKFMALGYSDTDFDFILEYNSKGYYIQSHI